MKVRVEVRDDSNPRPPVIAAIMGSARRARARRSLPPSNSPIVTGGRPGVVSAREGLWRRRRAPSGSWPVGAAVRAGVECPGCSRAPARASPAGEPSGLPAGAPLRVGGVLFEATTVPLYPGDQLILYTDGFVETRREAIDERLDPFLRLLDGPDRSLEEACDRLLDTCVIRTSTTTWPYSSHGPDSSPGPPRSGSSPLKDRHCRRRLHPGSGSLSAPGPWRVIETAIMNGHG
ncbi:SpoIIE family protein phosphatase [Streptomyces aureus]|uniref:SpoIIE family protein phosphatase n=1 Tax=Streptomyces aureus TaxID=193461 RepID=A0ABV4SVW3_9ACTN